LKAQLQTTIKTYIPPVDLMNLDMRLKVVKGCRIGKMKSLKVYKFGSKSEAKDKRE